MNDYVRVRLDLMPCSPDMTDLMAAFLADIGYESFVPDENGLEAFIPATLFSKSDVRNIIDTFPFETKIEFSHESVEGRDWNEEWEKNYFKPIVIDDQCVIHSTFHKNIPACRYDIVIDPKMAFGTGHHATTTLILRRLLGLDLTGLKVVDMGTGTGILAILCDMRGAALVDAVEIDGFVCENARENLRFNGASRVKLHHGDAAVLAGIRDVNLFLANINRNIITADLCAYADTLAPGAQVILSGFYEEDIPVIMKTAEVLGLSYGDHTVLDRWASLRLVYNQ